MLGICSQWVTEQWLLSIIKRVRFRGKESGACALCVLSARVFILVDRVVPNLFNEGRR